MAKIHTHYDNLKVARGAPQEVVRAAYKALSQKYHPDKNPGDEKAARIMAIVNTAYNILSDPVRRKEHDEWIAAEEWEVAWLESSSEEGGRTRADGAEGAPALARPARHPLRDPRWWLGIAGGIAVGAVAVLLVQQPRLLLGVPGTALAFGKGAAPGTVALTAPAPVAAPDPDPWATQAGPTPPPAPVKALAVTQLQVPARQPDCASDLATLVAPNGEPWPGESGYLPGYPMGNLGKEMTVVVDNSANPSPVFVKIHDLERQANVRHAYVLANATFTVDALAAGKYAVRYQNVVSGAARGDCMPGAPLRQADAAGAGF